MGRKNDDGQPNDQKDENFRGVLLLEEECVRYVHVHSLLRIMIMMLFHSLRESERSLRQELLLATAAASATEQSLKSLIKRLQRQIHMLVNDITRMQ